MIILKYVDLTPERPELKRAADHIQETVAQTDGIRFLGLYTSLTQRVVVAMLEAQRFEDYLAWLHLCLPPPGVRASHEVLPPFNPEVN